MSLDLTLPKDPAQAATLLAALAQKSEQECSYPTCHDPRQPASGTGRPSNYCTNPKHNAVTSHRARQQLRALVARETTETAARMQEPSPTPVSAESLRVSVLSRMTLLQADLDRYVTILADMADPDVANAQMKARLDQATAHVAEAQQQASQAAALRLKAEADLLLAQQETQAEREAAEQAIAAMEEMEASMQRQQAEAEERIATIQAERDRTIEALRIQTERQIQQIQRQVDQALAVAQAETIKAQEEAKAAHAAAVQSSVQAAAAEQLVSELRTNLARERQEVDRLHHELAETIAEARRRTEADRAEANTALARERAEIDRLREESATSRKQMEAAITRADRLASLNDDLRMQLAQQRTPLEQ